MPVDLQTQEQFKRVIENEEVENVTNDDIEKDLDDLTKMHEAESLLTNAKDARRKYDREWLNRDLFRRGYQFASQDPSTGSVTITSATKARIPINLTWAYMRAIKNQVTSFNPKWEVMPDFKGAKSEQNARLTGKLLDYLYKKMNLNKLIKEAIIQGLQFSVGGPFEAYWDPDYDNGPNNPRGEIVITLHDPYDIYVDPKATSLEDAEYVVKCVRTPISEIKANTEYGPAKDQLVGGTSKLAESEYKQFLLQTIYNTQSSTAENETVILKEIQKKERGENGDVKIRILTWCDGVVRPLRNILVDKEEFDMESFQADMNPLEFYGPSWMKHVMPLNKALNALESSVFEYAYRFAKGRLVIDKNAGVDIVTNEHGSIIEKERGSEVSTLPIAPLPSDITNQIIRLRMMMEDISGVHEASLGRTPGSVKSGIGIAELKQSDSSNQDDLVQNLEHCLMRLGRKILRLIAENYTTPRIAKVVGTGRMIEHFAVVGRDYVSDDKTTWKIGEEEYPLAKIGMGNELQVSIGSWLAYSKEARQKMILDLATAGILAKEDVLRHLEFPNVQDAIDRVRAEQIVELKRKESDQMPSGISQEQLALAENEMLSEGLPAPVDPIEDDHELHIAVHMTEIGQGRKNQLVASHIQEHRRSQKGGGRSFGVDQMLQSQEPQRIPIPPAQMGQGPAMPPEMPGGQVPLPPAVTQLSAGVAEVPPTAGSIIGGPTNALPTSF